MRHVGFRALSVALLLVFYSSLSHAATYVGSLLHPPTGFSSTIAFGVSDSNQVGVGRDMTLNQDHALLWTGSASSVVDLNPPGWQSSTASATSGPNQAGFGFITTGGPRHALLWNSTAASFVDLNPIGSPESQANEVSGSQQAGWAGTNQQYHATLWSGTSSSFVDLHPAGFLTSMVVAISGPTQAGFAHDSVQNSHAMLWKGTAASAIDLHPAGFARSGVYGVAGTSQVGYAQGLSFAAPFHAILWNGTSASAIDLTPAGFNTTEAWDISPAGQVGYGRGTATGGENHALLWTGSAASAVDLHSLITDLNPAFVRSFAYEISDNGTIVGLAQTANGTRYAVMWTPVPEPASSALVTGGFVVASLMSRRRRLARTQNPGVLETVKPGEHRLSAARATTPPRAPRPGIACIQLCCHVREPHADGILVLLPIDSSHHANRSGEHRTRRRRADARAHLAQLRTGLLLRHP